MQRQKAADLYEAVLEESRSLALYDDDTAVAARRLAALRPDERSAPPDATAEPYVAQSYPMFTPETAL